MTRDEFERRQDDQFKIIEEAIKNIQALAYAGFKNPHDQMSVLVNCRKLDDNTADIRRAWNKLEELDEFSVDD